MQKVGIDRISFYTPRRYLDMRDLAEARGVDPDKFTIGLGQEKMGVIHPSEDIVTMAAHAAEKVLEGEDRSNISMILFCTESSVDQSKASGIWVHSLLGLEKNVRIVELKQACFAGCAGLLLAMSHLREHPDKKVLLLTSDVARYGLKTAGEATQGAAACAMLLSHNPRICTVDPETGAYTAHVMDFWRPNYSSEAFVDGKYSTKIYLEALSNAWCTYKEISQREYSSHARFCYHTPFTKMALKAHDRLSKLNQAPLNDTLVKESLSYSKEIGNSYTASLFIGLLSLLENTSDDLTENRVGLFSYGSGCVAEFFSVKLVKDYQNYLFPKYHQALLKNREMVSVSEYEALYQFSLPTDGSSYEAEPDPHAKYLLKGIENHIRLYETV